MFLLPSSVIKRLEENQTPIEGFWVVIDAGGGWCNCNGGFKPTKNFFGR